MTTINVRAVRDLIRTRIFERHIDVRANTDTPTPCLTCKPWLTGSHLTDGPHPRETSTP